MTMTPQPMDEDDIIKCIVQAGCLGTVKMTFESGPYDITRTSINADKLARAILAARDAQWVAMLGEPVACFIRSRTYTPASASHDGQTHYHEWGEWQPATFKHGMAVTDPARNTSPKVWDMQPLYAIKETP